MKKYLCLLTLCLLLTACNQRDLPGEETAEFIAPPGAATMTCRVMEEEDGTLLLAQVDGRKYDVFTTSCRDVEVKFEDPARTEIEEGDLVEIIFDGSVMETYPAHPSGVEEIWVWADGYDDTARLYLEVFEVMVEEDSALAHDADLIGLDLSETTLSPAEQSAAALLLEWETGLTVLEGTWEELVDQGYIDGENLYWEDGYFLSATEKERTDTGLVFSAQLWRSGLGALFYSDCNVGREVNGPWEEYIVGVVAIS
ncbi:MAG: hypothetical protein IKB65_08390 [Ruminiclostridium sp.]|nr:hypothetical protein [Ruminiclostridium sp.]